MRAAAHELSYAGEPRLRLFPGRAYGKSSVAPEPRRPDRAAEVVEAPTVQREREHGRRREHRLRALLGGRLALLLLALRALEGRVADGSEHGGAPRLPGVNSGGSERVPRGLRVWCCGPAERVEGQIRGSRPAA
jgi:hypothetical protein